MSIDRSHPEKPGVVVQDVFSLRKTQRQMSKPIKIDLHFAACELAKHSPQAAEAMKITNIAVHSYGLGKNIEDVIDNGPNISNIIGIAGNVTGLAGNININCFTAGMQIVVGMEYDADGVFVQYVTANIEDIQVGDLVYSYNTETGEVSQKAVTSTSALSSDHINYLTIMDESGNEQTIETTDAHPFWVVTNDPDLSRAARDYVFENGVWLYHEDVTPTEHGYWVEAKDLKVGDIFLGANGELSTLTKVSSLTIPFVFGMTASKAEGRAESIIFHLQRRFGEVPASLESKLLSVFDLDLLCHLRDLSFDCNSLDAFESGLV